MSPHATTILTALLAADRPMGGYDLIHATRFGAGRLYPALQALVVDGLVVGEFEGETAVGDRPARRLYTLTTPGADRARALTQHARSE